MNRDSFFRFLTIAVFVLHFGLSLAYNAIIPLNRGPDEESHYRYFQHLIEYRSLPQITRPKDIQGTRDERTGAIAIHPPLYYVVGLPVYLAASPLSDEARQRALRLLATAFAFGTLIFVLRIARVVFLGDVDLHGIPVVETAEEVAASQGEAGSEAMARFETVLAARQSVQVAMLGFVAFLPHFLLMSSVINNDGLFILLNTWLVFLIVRSALTTGSSPGVQALTPSPSPKGRGETKARVLLAVGAVFGLCLLTKASALALAPLMFIIALMHAKVSTSLNLKEEREYSMRKWTVNLVMIFGPAWLIAGWWYLWYYHVHGRLYFIPKVLDYSFTDFLTSGQAPALIWRYLHGISQSIWSQVDWILPNDPRHPEQAMSAAYPLSGIIWWLFMAWLILATLVNVLFFVTRRSERALPQFPAIMLCYLHFGLYFFALMYSTLFIHPGGFQGGRYLLPGVAGFSLFFCVALHKIALPMFIGAKGRTRRALLIAWPQVFPWLLLFWNYACIRNLREFLIPVYAGQ